MRRAIILSGLRAQERTSRSNNHLSHYSSPPPLLARVLSSLQAQWRGFGPSWWEKGGESSIMGNVLDKVDDSCSFYAGQNKVAASSIADTKGEKLTSNESVNSHFSLTRPTNDAEAVEEEGEGGGERRRARENLSSLTKKNPFTWVQLLPSSYQPTRDDHEGWRPQIHHSIGQTHQRKYASYLITKHQLMVWSALPKLD